MRIKPDRAHYIPKGSLCVRDKASSAVVYLYGQPGKPAALAFQGRRQKPDWHYSFRSEAAREQRITTWMEGVRRNDAYKAERDAANKANRRKGAALDFAGKDYLSAADTAALCRAALKETFPGVKFSVRADSSINVEWTDGPSRAAVEHVAKLFEGSYFDGMIDYKGSVYHSLDGRRVSFGADFVFTRRNMSTDALRIGLAAYEAADPRNPGAVTVSEETDRWGTRATVTATPGHAATLEGRFPGELEIEGPGGHESGRSWFRPDLALELWFDHARPVEPQPSATLARVAFLGSDGYGVGGGDPVDGGEGMRGYPRPKEPEGAKEAREAVDTAEREAATLLQRIGFGQAAERPGAAVIPFPLSGTRH